LEILKFSLTATRAATAALVVFCLVLPVSSALAWSEFGTSDKKDEGADLSEGPEIREPFFEFLLGMAIDDSLGTWTGEELRAHAAAGDRESRFPLDEVVSLRRARPDSAEALKYRGAMVRAVWTLLLTEAQDRPMPYSILGYHPGSLRVGGELVLSELAPTVVDVTYIEDDEQITGQLTEVRIFPLEKGYVVLDADGFLDALLGSGLDDAWTLGFVVGREEGKLVGLGVSLGRKGRQIYGEFDFSQDKVRAHGRAPMAGLSRASRRWLNVDDGNLPAPWVED
jgi:hypothetical protein